MPVPPLSASAQRFHAFTLRYGYVAAAAIRPGGNQERARLAVRLGLCAAFALNTMAFSLPGYLGMPEDFEFADLFRIIACLSASLSMLVGAGYFIDRAWRSIRVGSLHMDLPIALGLIVAYLGSLIGWAWGVEGLMYFDFVSVFVFLMLGGRYLQTAAVDRNRRRLVRSQPVPVELSSRSNTEEKIPRDALVRGTEFMLQPGQAMPVSGLLSAGEADFSLEWIHGEADPVHFGVGSRLPAGAILLSREPAMMTADESWHDSLLSRLTATVTAERVAPGLDRLLRIYLLVVMCLGIAGLVGWAWMGDWLTGAQAMVSVFVVSCPCALGVAVPLADSLAASALERLGVFVRSGSLWSRMRKVDHVVFDKTGTLTLERPQLISPSRLADLRDEEALALARLTSGSLHPVSRSLLENLGFRGQQLLQQQGRRDVSEFPGLGVMLEDEDVCWSLGKSGWNAADGSVQSDSSRSELRKNGNLVASFDFNESLRPDVMRTMHFLKRRGLLPHILSGDRPDKVAIAADALGIPKNQVHGGLSPEEKAARIREMKGNHTLYLG
ncbi:MAG: HAD-IC family P-type ATPase, partial [Luteolibacter sp.]